MSVSQHPDELAAELVMASLSTLLSEGLAKLQPETQAAFREQLAAGSLRVNITLPPLRFAISIADSDGVEREFFDYVDERSKSWGWASDLARVAQ